MRLHEIAPDAEVLLSLQPEELAGVVLEYLNSLGPDDCGQLNRYNFTLTHTVEGYPRELRKSLLEALAEAWWWLEREGLIAPRPGSDSNWVFITRRGRQLRTAAELLAFNRSNLLPKAMLHPAIAHKVWSTFLRGDYDTAVFQAFKEVEVLVRSAAGLPTESLGTDLMRKAFDASNGPLTDTESPMAERESLAHLFAGAIGSYKNPQSHRTVNIGPEEAAEIIILASHLLRITEVRRTDTDGGA